jgi:plasmid stabilization system protein ParE
MIIRFTPDADTELAEARQWPFNKKHTIAKTWTRKFMERIDDALSLIVRDPRLYPIVYKTLRRVVVRRFPFAVFYEVMANEIQVIAVFHSRRDPEIWKSRAE